jgi:hypothetical protein
MQVRVKHQTSIQQSTIKAWRTARVHVMFTVLQFLIYSIFNGCFSGRLAVFSGRLAVFSGRLAVLVVV